MWVPETVSFCISPPARGVCLQEMEMLRDQVEFLTEENGKLAGHQNPLQKIHYVIRLKKVRARALPGHLLSFKRATVLR